MFIVGLLTWWYGEGWLARAQMFRERLASTLDYFSIDLLIGTLFAPFRQISAGKVDGPLGVRFRAWIDRLISRVIGFFVRVIVIIIGCASLVFYTIIGFVTLLMWALVPVLPFIGFIMFLTGWVPSL